MSRVLVIRPSSLGDIVHALPIVRDLELHRPDAVVDWVAEEPFAPLVRLNRGVHRVIPVALRRWRHHMMAPATWRELLLFRRDLNLNRYDAVLDLQEQLKGALMAWLARGPVHGPDRASIREPAATLFYRHRHSVDSTQHLIDRCRQLAAKAFGYVATGAPCFDISPPLGEDIPTKPYVVLLHSTSRPDKLWPESHWRRLIAYFGDQGYEIILPWGNDAEAARSGRLAENAPGAIVPPRRDLPQLCALLDSAKLVCGVDTGLVHLAAAIGVPTVSLFVATDPLLAGVERASECARDLGGVGIVPDPDRVIQVAETLMQAGPRD